MKSVVIKGKQREAVGKKDTKKLRSEGNVPCVLYGGDKPIHFYAPFNEFRKIVYTPSVYLLDVDIDGKVYKAIMQDIQWHPVEEQILHIDFLIVRDDKPIKIEIPVQTNGLAKGIKQGGKLKSNLRKLKVKAFAKDLPDTIEINVEDLALGDSVKVEDLSFKNIEFLDNKSNVVVSVNITRAAMAAMTTDETEEEGTEEKEASETTENS
ncbi:MAG: 50S ribosomal protein L25/general stress protein Ctc [Chlorobi bacterium]|nr:50S ribosomal protein L25/general stress protein Ctc [Chlorobiota bacterium]